MVKNAIQHGGADLRRIQVGMTLDEQSKAVVMCIDDDGRGVPESERSRIFQAGVSQNFESTGLGLSLVKRVFEEELRGVFEALLLAKLRNALEQAREARMASLANGNREATLVELWGAVTAEPNRQKKVRC